MKVFFYCQHVLGIGHFFRSLEICRALDGHEVTFIIGGPRPEVELPSHVREFSLPGLMMDAEFSSLFPTEQGKSLEQVKRERSEKLTGLFRSGLPDFFIVELYPFGRKAFGFELEPVLERIRNEKSSGCRAVCSLRDILVEKKDPEKYELRVAKILNRYFDALLVHADPEVLRLDETFSRMDLITIPIHYTGFVTQAPEPDARWKIRQELGISDARPLIVASAGGGKVGAPLLHAAVSAFLRLTENLSARLVVFTGPLMDDSDFERLRLAESEKITVRRFTSRFLSYLAAADLSVSMGGYNTCMNVLASGTRGLIWPFSQNREQRMRAIRLAKTGAIEVLQDSDLEPAILERHFRQALLHKKYPSVQIDLQGGIQTARCLETWG